VTRGRVLSRLVIGSIVLMQASGGVAIHGVADAAAEAGSVSGPQPLRGAITVIVDDMDDFSCADTGRFLPRSSRYLRRGGTCYEDATVASPVCCPSRAAYMTGEYPHNNHVTAINEGLKLTVEDSIQFQLRSVGVTTFGVGKFLNGVPLRTLASPRFDTGFTEAELWKPNRYLDYKLIDKDGKIYTPKRPVHTTTRTGNYLNDFIKEQVGSDDRFYAYAAFSAPHAQHRTRPGESRLPLPTAANRRAEVPPLRYRPERDTRDKLPLFRTTTRGRAHYERWHAARVRSLFDVDARIAGVFETLEKHDLLDSTAVFFTSDNGYHLGQNNWEEKGAPYSASLDVPLLAYLPGVFEGGAVVKRPVNLIDLAPTLYDLFGVSPTNVLDGHSLLARAVRQDGFWELSRAYGGEDGEKDHGKIPSWAKLERHGRTFIQYYDRGGRVIAEEFYQDAGEQRNLLWSAQVGKAPSPMVVRKYRQALLRSRTCSGTRETGSARPCP
jgi:arylsulfatase A-like enzyme